MKWMKIVMDEVEDEVIRYGTGKVDGVVKAQLNMRLYMAVVSQAYVRSLQAVPHSPER